WMWDTALSTLGCPRMDVGHSIVYAWPSWDGCRTDAGVGLSAAACILLPVVQQCSGSWETLEVEDMYKKKVKKIMADRSMPSE
ncbi:MAG: hypothetical protein LGB05_07990, partial [Sulfurovum sp.]|nr:hypothetical protein [Sulfurovum sp.]